MMKSTFRALGIVVVAGLSAWAQANNTARPGTVNYIEGKVSVNGRALGSQTTRNTLVEPGQVLSTGQGKAEMLLTPGVFLRLGDHASVRMVSPSLIDTRVDLMSGEAMLEADEVLKANHLVISDHGVDTRIMKRGVYRFTTDPPQVSVYDGKAQVFADDRVTDLGKGKQILLAQAATAKPQKFDREHQDGLYQWSDVRSEYLSQANESSVQTIVAGGYPWGGLGWYWNPWFDSWAFVPGDGLFYSPFGFGFYSPAYWSYYPPVRFYSRPGNIVVNRGAIVRNPGLGTNPSMRAPMTMRAPMAGGGFRGGIGGGGMRGGMRGGGRR